MKKLKLPALIGALLCICTSTSAQKVTVTSPEVIPMTYLGTTVPLRDYVEDPDAVNEITREEKLGYHAKHDWPLHQKVNPNARPKGLDPVLQKIYPTAGLQRSIQENFDGQGYTSVNPPDPSMDVSSTHVIQMINAGSGASFQIWNIDGTVAMAATQFDNFFGLPGGLGDPIVLHDQLADRWLLSEFASSSNALHVAISQTSDPLGAYHTYTFTTPQFPDYPKFSVWHDAYYVTTNEADPSVYALDRINMLSGNAATSQRFTMPSVPTLGFQTATPVDLEGPTAAPAGTPGYIMRMVDDGWAGSINEDYLEIWEFDVDWATPANSSLSGPDTLHTEPFDTELCGYTSFSCIDQPSSTDLDPLREVLMNRIHYRNLGSYETILCNHVTDVDGTDHAGIRWYELRKTTDFEIYQQGTYSPDSDNRWMAGIAMNDDGAIGLAYNVSGSSTFPSIRYTGRRDCDPLGMMTEPETSIVEGSASNASNRYGDYSAMSVDPATGHFWFTGQYNPASQWSTRIASFDIGSCSPTVAFVGSSSAVSENNADTDNGCLDYKEYKIAVKIGIAPSQPANLTFSNSGTANEGAFADYTFSPAQVTLQAGNLSDTITVRVYDDPYVEATEDIMFAYALNANGGDATAGSINQTFTMTITSDDLEPLSATQTTTFIDEDFNEAVTGWTEVAGGSTPDTWEIITGYNGNSSNSLDGTPFYMCDSDAPGSGSTMNEQLLSPILNTLGAQNLTLEFDQYFREYNPGFNETIDVDIYDGSTWQNVYHVEEDLSGSIGGWNSPDHLSIDITAHANANLQVRLTFIAEWDWWWAIDNFKITGTSNIDIQTDVNTGTTEARYFGPNSTVHFYDDLTGNIIASLTNNGATDFGCTTVEVDRQGTLPGAEPFNSNSPSTLLHSKSFKITPDNVLPGNYDVTLFYQENEVSTWESLTAVTRSDASVVKVAGNNAIADVNPGNVATFTIDSDPVTLGSFGTDVTFTGQFDSGFSGFGVGRYCGLLVSDASDAGSGTLRDAIECAEDGDTIFFAPALNNSDIIISSTPIQVTNDIVIFAQALDQITLDASGLTRAIHVLNGAQTEIHGLIISSGDHGIGRGIWNQGDLLIHDVTIDDHPTAGVGELLTNEGSIEVEGNCNVKEQ